MRNAQTWRNTSIGLRIFIRKKNIFLITISIVHSNPSTRVIYKIFLNKYIQRDENRFRFFFKSTRNTSFISFCFANFSFFFFLFHPVLELRSEFEKHPVQCSVNTLVGLDIRIFRSFAEIVDV